MYTRETYLSTQQMDILIVYALRTLILFVTISSILNILLGETHPSLHFMLLI